MAKTRYLVRPRPRLQKLQRDIRKQFGTYKSTYLAKVNGTIRLPGGLFWVHDATGTDANGNTIYGAPRKMPMLPGAAIFPRPNTKVDVVTIQGIDYIARTNSFELERMGVDPHQSNTLDPVVQYKALDWIINLQAFKTPGASSTHIIGSIYKKPDGDYAVFPTTGGYDFVTANIPSTDNQVVVCQWIDTDTNTVTATVSSEETRDTDLKHPDNIATTLALINECVASAPANHIGVNAWRVYDDSTIGTMDDNNKLADLRGIVGAGGGSFTVAGDSGTPQTIDSANTLTIAGGVGLASVASATDTLTVNLDIPSLTADASPDGAADYVVTYDASASMHKKVLLDDLPGGGGGMTSFTAAGDGGTPQTIGNGNTLTIAGGLGLASTASATDTVTLDLDVNSLTEDATPDTSADYAVTYDASASTHKKVKLVNLVTSGTGSLSTVQAWTELGTTAATLSVSGISGSYDYLEVILNLRTDRASQKLDDLIVYMNSDQTAGNYRSTGHYITGGNATGVQTYRGVTVGGFAVYFGANGASATSNYFAAITMRIYNYASTVPYKTMRYDGYVDGSAALDSDIGMLNGGGIWLSTSAITGVTIKPRYGSNFVAGSAWGVYAR